MTDHDVSAAIAPALVGTAFESGSGDLAKRTPLWCVGTDVFRSRHPDLTDAVDWEHPDGCTDLGIYVDRNGRLDRVTLEMLDVAPDLAGRPIEDVLPEVVTRLDRLLHRRSSRG